ncbi:hypothetical protein CJ030_MR2G013166 [Morella rubra]|uniref:Uncharacterized protein n=1 Tax=Morella rubra TaxID=262757 RepID=A0A6A1W871_9ROSI|nr:hypothetical protein CJ030_MR2G013166 [Morella rubra]
MELGNFCTTFPTPGKPSVTLFVAIAIVGATAKVSISPSLTAMSVSVVSCRINLTNSSRLVSPSRYRWQFCREE